MPSDQNTIAAHMRHFVEAALKLLSHHLELARIELIGDAKAYGIRLGLLIGMLPLLLMGYIFLCAAGASALGRVGIPFDLALVIVGGGHIVIAAVVILVALRGLKTHKPLANTLRETKLSLDALGAGPLQPQLEASDGR
jgi:hypothetical protein